MLRVIGAFALLIAVAAAWVMVPRDQDRLHVIGDLAGVVVQGLTPVLSAHSFTPDPRNAGTQIILVTDWAKLLFVPGAVEICGEDCPILDTTRLVDVKSYGLNGPRRALFLNISQFLNAENKTKFEFTPEGLACVTTGLASEIRDGDLAIWPESCVKSNLIDSILRIGSS